MIKKVWLPDKIPALNSDMFFLKYISRYFMYYRVWLPLGPLLKCGYSVATRDYQY